MNLPSHVPGCALWPVRIVRDAAKAIRDVAMGPFTAIIVGSKVLRDLIKAMAPAAHHFVPVDITRATDAVLSGAHFVLKAGGQIENGIIVDQSNVTPWIRKRVVKRHQRTRAARA
jgi:hypothetical protein